MIEPQGPPIVDREAAAVAGDRLPLRVWLRLLTCTNLIETDIRARLRTEFDTTLPRFDVLAQLQAAGDLLTMSELSARLMVTSGNVTGLIDAMQRDGLVSREAHPQDRRSILVRTTERGRALFEAMAPVHQGWIDRLTHGLTRSDLDQLYDLLGRLKRSARS